MNNLRSSVSHCRGWNAVLVAPRAHLQHSACVPCVRTNEVSVVVWWCAISSNSSKVLLGMCACDFVCLRSNLEKKWVKCPKIPIHQWRTKNFVIVRRYFLIVCRIALSVCAPSRNYSTVYYYSLTTEIPYGSCVQVSKSTSTCREHFVQFYSHVVGVCVCVWLQLDLLLTVNKDTNLWQCVWWWFFFFVCHNIDLGLDYGICQSQSSHKMRRAQNFAPHNGDKE